MKLLATSENPYSNPIQRPYSGDFDPAIAYRAGIFKESMGARNRGGRGLSYRPARLHRLAQFIPWNRFLGSRNVYKYGLWKPPVIQKIVPKAGCDVHTGTIDQ